jgi:hypothetical protein
LRRKNARFSHFTRTFLTGFLLTFLALVPSHSEESNPYKLGPGLSDTEKPSQEPSPYPFHFEQNEWNKMRRTIEDGGKPGEETVTVEKSTVTVQVEPPKPPPGQISFELPYESALSITGRKVIKVDIQNKHITGERAKELGTAQDTQSFTMEQELQAKIQGTVARKTTINVNFDDTKENVQDFSVVYKGDPDEVVQEAAFGDIVLSLPATEFVNYQKQLFGIRASLKYKKAGLMVIGSRTKGTTETKRFTGSTERKQKTVSDVDYIRRKFFDLTFSTASAMQAGPLLGQTITPLSDAIPEQVFIEDTTGLLLDATDYAVALATTPSQAVTIRMRRMSRGVDYSIDRLKGIITFTNPVNEANRVAVDFSLSNGERIKDRVINVSGAPSNIVGVLLKDKVSQTPNPEANQEIKRFYSTGDRNIVRDNSLGNFLLTVKDPNQQSEIGSNSSIFNPTLGYPGTIEMNFDTGIFEVYPLQKKNLPFSDLYNANVSVGTPLHAVFVLEYQALKRTFFLRPNIVLQSETISVDGRKLNRDLDYFIDYDIGTITFFNDDLIRDSSVIEATYEFAPFGGQLGETLVGARATYDILTNQRLAGASFDSWTVGSTVLYNFSAKPTSPPDIRSTPSSLLVTEGDTKVNGLKFGTLPVNTNLTIEEARSTENPNLFGKALVDSMEGIRQEDSASLLEDAWQVAANPQGDAYNDVSDFRGRESSDSSLTWAEADVATTDPNDGDATQKGLTIGYNLGTSGLTPSTSEQVSMVHILSLNGRDFSKKTSLEVDVRGAGTTNNAGNGVELIIEYGTFNEDADGDGFVGQAVLDSEDTVPQDGILNLGEDVGFAFQGPGPDLDRATTSDNITVRVGNGNTRLDSEDFNSDRALNTVDQPATFTPIFQIVAGDPMGLGVSDLSFSDRRLFKVDLHFEKLSETEKARLLAVRQIRVTIRNSNAPGNLRVGNIQIAKIAIVGNTWQPAELIGTSGSTMSVTAINNKDGFPLNQYQPLFGLQDFNDLYKGNIPESDTREQALALTYDMRPGSTATTKSVYGAPRDFSKHDILKFFVRKLSNDNDCSGSACGNGQNGQLFFQAGSETEYQQATINIENIPKDSWGVITLRQADLNGDGTPDQWESLTPGVVITRSGSVPALTSVSQLKFGIVNSTDITGPVLSNQIWINEIHQSDPHERNGAARRYSFDSAWTNWMDFGGTYRDVDRLFQTPTSAITNQDRKQTSSFVNFNRVKFLPMTYKRSVDETFTPAAFRTNTNALVSFLQEGSVRNETNNATARLLLPGSLPAIDMSYDNSTQKANLTQRTDRADTWRVGTSIASKSTLDVLPGKFLTFRPLPTSITYSHTEARKKLDYSDTRDLIAFGVSTAPLSSTDLIQTSQEDDVRMAFKPFESFTFNPSFRLKTEKDRRNFRDDEVTALPTLGLFDNQRTPRAISQTVTAQGNVRVAKWLTPQYNYSLTGSETNKTPDLSNATNYLLKTISRTGQGELSAAIQINQLLPRFRPVQSLNFNTSYKLESGDNYENVPNSFKWRNKLWAGQELDISSSTSDLARRTSLTRRKTFRTNMSWLPWSAYKILNERWKPLSSFSLTNNFQTSIEDQEVTGTNTHIEARTFPDLIITISDTEKFFGIKRGIDKTRLTVRNNATKKETTSISKAKTDNIGADYLFTLIKKYDVSTTYNINHSREDNLITNQLTSKSKTEAYSIQTGFPWRKVWRFTPRYERSKTDARDAIRITNDLLAETYSIVINGDLDRPLGLRIGRTEYGLTNRFIVNSTVKWDKKRSNINPSTNYLDIYSLTLSGDYTISKNFRLAVGGNFNQEKHHPDFKKLDQVTFGINSTLTIQF